MKSLAKLPIIPIVAVLLGMMLLTEFYTHLALGHFTENGFAEGVRSLSRLDNAPVFWKEGLMWTADRSAFFAPFFAPLLAITAVCLILLLVRGFILGIAALIFFVYWVSQWAYPGVWIFEFLFPFAFAICAACASFKEGILGCKLFGQLKLPWCLSSIPIVAAALWYVIILGKNAGEQTTSVAWQTALTFAVLFGISALMDKARREKSTESHWIAIMVLIIGAMMTLQVFADQAVGFYTEEGYANLVRSYAQDSSSPDWYRAFLAWSADHAALFMPLQALFEALAAVLLSLFILRGPALLLTALMFAVFTYAEFGVKAELPSSPIHTFTNTWELLFVTIAALFISIRQTAQMWEAPTWREKILGPPVFGHLNLFWKIVSAILAGAALFGAGVKTHVFTEHYLRTSWLGGISFAILLFINALIDLYRAPTE